MAGFKLAKNIIFPLKQKQCNLFFSRNLVSKQLVYSEFGEPLQVVKLREVEVQPLKEQEVLVRMLAAPVNPADINTIQGKYPVKVNLPCVPGNEGVGIVEDMGNGVKGLATGNRVIVTKPVQGTWRDIAVINKDYLRVVPDTLGLVEAATLTVNPCTAYRMLSDFKPVKDGLVVIQNGANSACGQNVIQICKAWGVKNVNIVRNRPDINELKKYLESLGATYVLTEEELRSTNIFREKKLNKPALALNCVGGKNSLEMLRHLQHSGQMVTYGGMSREPVTIPTSAFIFKNLSFHGFWMTAWNEKATVDEKNKMFDDLVKMMCENKLKGPTSKMVKFANYEEALGNALSPQGFTGCKYILDFCTFLKVYTVEMDQPIYEAYEFLQDDESQNESQFLVVQNDGTFLTVNRPIQYISQGENVKTVLQGAPAEFDANQQEFFVQNSQELITDQFVVSNGDNNEYDNSFLLKTIENVKNEAQSEQPEYEISNYVDGKPIEDTDMESQEIQNTYEDVPAELANTEEKAPSQGDCTEITLSDEQYQLLQEKGWILLDFADKKFLLDSVGLHDITDNHELQEKLRSEVADQNTAPENNSSSPDLQEFIKTETGDQTSANAIDQDIQDTTRVINKSNLKTKNKGQRSNEQIVFKQESKEVEVETSPANVPVLSHNPIKIKTNYLFKDIPSRVVLGKTAKGQDLVARVVKTNRPMADTTANVNSHPSGPNYTGLTELRFERLVRQKLNESEQTRKEDIAAAQVVVKQLLSVPSFRNIVVGRQLVITKSITTETTVGVMYSEKKCTLVTGKVNDEGQGLTYIPKMLQKLLSDGEAILYFRRSKDINEGSFLHIHVSEMKAVDGIVRVSITLNKRHLPLKLVKEQIKLRQVYACSSCAVMFEGEEQLRHHQETECMEVDNTLTIDTDNQKSAYTVIVEEGKEKQFMCNQCQMTFTKLGACQRHVKIHYNNENEATIIEESEKQRKKGYKCKMCPSTYSHQATLSKHIVAKHLKAEVSMMNQAKIIKTYSRSSQVQNPIEIDDDDDEQPKGGKSVYYKCKMCPSTYVHPATLTKHILSEHVRNKIR
ncbi:uncharacterized protein LOC121735669 [Aricia agestis]|uniref:uncharacterized protein LOC121735669 n=1 Tax=Aricia agestis TaxID=91739 RepID=UPI001C20A292|nr:uncharacterized protein LOC121735669 [Aricia agestis]